MMRYKVVKVGSESRIEDTVDHEVIITDGDFTNISSLEYAFNVVYERAYEDGLNIGIYKGRQLEAQEQYDRIKYGN